MMLGYAPTLLVLTALAGLFGFGVLAGTTATLAKGFLALCLGLVLVIRAHGTKVSARTQPGHEVIRATSPLGPLFPANVPGGRGELVLVVDDDDSMRRVTQRMLETFGYRVVTACNGAEGVAVYARRMPEIALVLTDMTMPVMDGAASIPVLMSLNPSVKIIAASGVEANERVARAAGGAVKDFLPKPYSAQTLLRHVREVIDQPADLVHR